ncbi:MAG: type II toxin-antitoxin system VapC family toxin [Chloroflexi bacterium]|nr:type II toxin-antitoxin system VapC family toxin [Chloroflexota bacterium]
MARYVTDAHALIWYAEGRSRKLGRRARAIYAAAEAGRAVVYVPALALAEVLEAVRRGTFRPAVPVSQWLADIFSSGAFQFAALTREVIEAGERLYTIPERGDRLIAATAVALQLPLISRDPALAGAAEVELVW